MSELRIVVGMYAMGSNDTTKYGMSEVRKLLFGSKQCFDDTTK